MSSGGKRRGAGRPATIEQDKGEGTVLVSFRVRKSIHKWLVMRAARETIAIEQAVNVSDIAREIIEREMKGSK